MENYKVKVNNEAESKEVQELLFELGYGFEGGCNKSFITFEYMYTFFFFSYEDGDLTVSGDNSVFSLNDTHKELTIPQLRDLVVLHRNDVKDATHKHIGGAVAYKTFDEIAYLWTRMGWEYKGAAHDLVPILKESEQALISGADALRALADGEEVEFKTRVSNWNLINKNDAYAFSLFLDDDSSFSFRLKPRNITLNMEIPAPFYPKVGDYVYFLCSDETKGYAETTLEDTPMNWGFVQFGAWRTEEEIKQVVAALRGALKNG